MTQLEAKALALVAVSKIEAATAKESHKREHIRKSLLSDGEIERLILNMIDGRHGCSETDVQAMIQAATTIRFLHSCLELALKGLVSIDVNTNEQSDSIDRLKFAKRESISAALQELLKAQKP